MPINNFSWVIPQKLSGSALPGGYDCDDPQSVLVDLRELSAHGVKCLISLQEVAPFFGELSLSAQMEWIPFFFPDFGVPSDNGEFSLLIDSILARMNQGFPVCVHCRAGIGRTGLVLACVLGDYLTLNASAAIAAVRKTRMALDTPTQETFVRHYLSKYQ